jgi:hypothetical protein
MQRDLVNAIDDFSALDRLKPDWHAAGAIARFLRAQQPISPADWTQAFKIILITYQWAIPDWAKAILRQAASGADAGATSRMGD